MFGHRSKSGIKLSSPTSDDFRIQTNRIAGTNLLHTFKKTPADLFGMPGLFVGIPKYNWQSGRFAESFPIIFYKLFNFHFCRFIVYVKYTHYIGPKTK